MIGYLGLIFICDLSFVFWYFSPGASALRLTHPTKTIGHLQRRIETLIFF